MPVRCRRHFLPYGDPVEIQLQHVRFVVTAFKLAGEHEFTRFPEDAALIAHERILGKLCKVEPPDRTKPGTTAYDCAQKTDCVEAAALKEAFILYSNRGILHICRNLVALVRAILF